MKVTCCYQGNDSLLDECVGECLLVFGIDIPTPPSPIENYMELKGKSKKDPVSGTIRFRSGFSGKETQREMLVQSDPAALKSVAIKRSNLIHVTASGRREIRYHDGQLNMVFGELPPIHFNAKPTNEHGYDCHLALWLVTCCQLAYREPAFIREVVQNIWGFVFFFFFFIILLLMYTTW